MAIPLSEHHGVDRARFEREIVPAERPAVLRGLVADWPAVAVAAARGGEAAFGDWLRDQASDEAGQVWFAPPAALGRFGFTDDLSGYEHDRKLASVAQIVDLLLRQLGQAEPFAVYVGALPVERHFPGFRAYHPMPPLAAELGPGDALYMPSLWRHAVDSLDDIGAMVNLWWRDGAAAEQVSPLLSLFDTLMTVGGMSDAERARWRVLFDHYAFRADGDPAAHLPPDARGILGDLSPTVLAPLRRRLAATL